MVFLVAVQIRVRQSHDKLLFMRACAVNGDGFLFTSKRVGDLDLGNRF